MKELLDFQRCERPNGTFYGTAGTCRKGSPAEPADEREEAFRAANALSDRRDELYAKEKKLDKRARDLIYKSNKSAGERKARLEAELLEVRKEKNATREEAEKVAAEAREAYKAASLALQKKAKAEKKA